MCGRCCGRACLCGGALCLHLLAPGLAGGCVCVLHMSATGVFYNKGPGWRQFVTTSFGLMCNHRQCQQACREAVLTTTPTCLQTTGPYHSFLLKMAGTSLAAWVPGVSRSETAHHHPSTGLHTPCWHSVTAVVDPVTQSTGSGAILNAGLDETPGEAAHRPRAPLDCCCTRCKTPKSAQTARSARPCNTASRTREWWSCQLMRSTGNSTTNTENLGSPAPQPGGEQQYLFYTARTPPQLHLPLGRARRGKLGHVRGQHYVMRTTHDCLHCPCALHQAAQHRPLSP